MARDARPSPAQSPVDHLAGGQAPPAGGRAAGHPPAEGGIELTTGVDIGVPPAEVFAFWRALENFPRFMNNVIEVRHEGQQRYLWRVAGPAGTEVSWHADVTAVEQDRRIAWASEKGASVENRGEVRFKPIAGGTRVDVRITYAPPAGIVGHAVATLFGKNPKQEMESDLARCRTLLEEGVADRGDGVVTAAEVRRDEATRRTVR